MIKKITVTNYLGDTIELELARPEKSGFLIRSITGLGPPKATINTTEVATNDGSLFNSSRASQRNIVIDLVFVDSVLNETIEDLRQKTYKYFPQKRDISLIIETDNRRVSTSGYVESNEPNIFSEQENTTISIICPDPYFYAITEDGNQTTDFYSVEPIFEFPFSNESLSEKLIEMSSMEMKSEGVVVYEGDADVGVSIFIHAIGDASGINIYNTEVREYMRIDTNKILAYTGKGVSAGDDIIITTSTNSKGIWLQRQGVTYNILNCLDKNTDWFTLRRGDNIFAITADGGVSNLQFRIENKIVYWGV